MSAPHYLKVSKCLVYALILLPVLGLRNPRPIQSGLSQCP
jgi:hypothetical protein